MLFIEHIHNVKRFSKHYRSFMIKAFNLKFMSPSFYVKHYETEHYRRQNVKFLEPKSFKDDVKWK